MGTEAVPILPIFPSGLEPEKCQHYLWALKCTGACCHDVSVWAETEAVRQWRGSLIGIGRQIMDVAFGVLEEACFLSALWPPPCYCMSDLSDCLTDGIKGPWFFSPASQASFLVPHSCCRSLFHFYLIAHVSSPLFSPPFVPLLRCSSFVTLVCHSPPTVLIPQRDASQCAKCINNFPLLLGNYTHIHTQNNLHTTSP